VTLGVAGILPANRGQDALDTYEFVSAKSLQGQVDIAADGDIAAASSSLLPRE
jgi:hypothetical protein